VFHGLKKFTVLTTQPVFHLDGREFRDAENLTELHLDFAIFNDTDNVHPSFWEENETVENENRYFLKNCRGLERVSILSVKRTYLVVDEDEDVWGDGELITVAISQKAIMKFVRFTPTLRWLRSELTDEHVAMLRQERPNVTFVRDFN
jgi:Xaa-Pro aminopeptidase